MHTNRKWLESEWGLVLMRELLSSDRDLIPLNRLSCGTAALLWFQDAMQK